MYCLDCLHNYFLTFIELTCNPWLIIVVMGVCCVKYFEPASVSGEVALGNIITYTSPSPTLCFIKIVPFRLFCVTMSFMLSSFSNNKVLVFSVK